MNPKTVKMISMAFSALGAAVSFGASVWEDKALDTKVAEKVAEALKNVKK